VTWEGRGRLGLHPDSNERLLDLTSGEVKALASSICDRIHDLPDGKAGTLAAFDLAREFDALTKLPKPPVADDPTKPDEEQPSDDEPTATDEPSTGESDDTASDESTNTKEADQPETTENDDATNDAEELSDDKLLELLEEAYGDDDGDEQQLEVSSRPKMLDDIGDETAKGGWLNLLSEPVFHHRTMPALCDYRNKDITQRSQMTRESGDINFQQTLDKMRGQLPTMRAKLRRALVTKQERTWLSGTKSGRFDGRRIVQATLGAEDVYMLRQDGTDIDTALSVVIDCSGSMQHGGKDRLARDTAIAIASALEGTGVAYEVVGFTNLHTYLTKDEQKMLDALTPSELTTHGAADRVHIYEFKRFDEPLRDARRAIGNTMEMIHHQNNDADSLLAVWSRLKKRQESRKLMIVLSDGEPAFDSYNIRKAGKIEAHMLNTIALIEGAGCGVIGIGIDSSCVSKFYKKHEVINSLNDLPVRVIDNVAKMLLGDAFVTDNSKLRRVS
jgi:cobaltochelatase CobT